MTNGDPVEDTELGPRGFQIDGGTGRVDPEWRGSTRTLQGMDGLFAAEIPAARLAETVYFTSTAEFIEAEGELGCGETWIEPGEIDGELFMTHGHLHRRPDGEVYIGQRGRGGVILARDDESVWVPMGEDTVCYIPPGWKHRAVNTGGVPFVFLSVYPALSGQDYEIVVREGMGARAIRDGQEVRIVSDAGELLATEAYGR